MGKHLNMVLSVVVFILVGGLAGPAFADQYTPMAVTVEHKCPTCGMRVASFENWHTQIVYDDGTNDAFCAVKCLMAFYFEPSTYSGKEKASPGKTLYAKDYYSQHWHDMKKMFFVPGSDVLGPMGKDLVPFSNLEHAKTFLKDHNGSKIFTFDEITPDLIQRLRKKKNKGL
jgi:copper chaperone NosL